MNGTLSPCMDTVGLKGTVSALTVHSHSGSQRVSLRGVSRALPFFCRIDKNALSVRIKSASCPPLCEHGDSPHCSLTDREKKRGSLSPSLSLHGHLLYGLPPGRVRYEAAPSESPPPSPYLTARRQKVITPWLLLDTD